jgi:hypothetical protein
MKKLFITLLLAIISFITYSQSGVGYVNYTSYKTHNGTASLNQYGQFANTAAEFDNMLNTANSNTTITHTGEVPLATMCNGSTGTPHWGGDLYAIKFEFWFIPTQTGSYSFGINSDDASDISVDGTIISTYYGGHGASGYQYGSKSMVAGTRYKIVARYQEYGGGDALYVRWSRPSAPSSYSYWNEEVTNINSISTKKATLNFYSAGSIDNTTFSGKIAYFTNTNNWTNISATEKSLSSVGKIDISADFDSTKTNMGFIFTQYPTANLTALTNQIVTISDVYLAFKELANIGLTGGGGNEFTSGIQYMNGDIDGNGVFNETDTYRLLQHITGARNLTDNCNTLGCWMKLINTTDYNAITKSNWKTSFNPTRDTYAPIVPTANVNTYNYNVNIFWKGDVNLSHSPAQNTTTTQSTNRTMNLSMPMEISTYILSELVDGKVVVGIKVNTLGQLLKGVQLKLNYDSDILKYENTEYTTSGNPTNFSNNTGNFISFGSLIYNGSGLLNDNTEYKLTFTPKETITNTIGLTSIEGVDAINVGGSTLKIKNL